MPDRYQPLRDALAESSAYFRFPGECTYCKPDGPAANMLRELLAERDALAAKVERTRDEWNEGFDFAMKACGWQTGEDPSTEGLYVVRDSKGNVEVGMWYAKTLTSPAEWTREFRDVDRDDIVAWMAIPDWTKGGRQ